MDVESTHDKNAVKVNTAEHSSAKSLKKFAEYFGGRRYLITKLDRRK